MKLFVKICITTILLSLLFECNSEFEKDETFLNVSKLNKNIKNDVGIDLMKYKLKADSLLKTDSDFYYKLWLDLTGVQWEVSEKINIPIRCKDNGELISMEESDNLARIIMLDFAANIKDDSCPNESTDSLCFYKNKWKTSLRGINPEKELIMYLDYFDGLEKLKAKKFLSQNEYNYLLIYSCLLISLERMNDISRMK